MAERNLRALSSGLIPDDFILPEGRLLLAFSGGEDSLFLMALLAAAAPDRSVALYVNHGIRERKELEREEELNACNASALGIPLVVRRIPSGEVRHLASEKDAGLEAAARELRYSILRSYAEENGFDHILTAHHLDDQAETVIMRMMSSSPVYSLSGILREDGMVFRPLLSVSKETIRESVRVLGLEVSEDSTNSDTGYLRNRIRHTILPYISENEKRILSRIAENCGEIRNRADILSGGDGYFLEYDRKEFLSIDMLSRDLTVFDAAQRLGVPGRFSRRLVSAISEKAEKGYGRILLPSFSVYVLKDRIRIYPGLDRFVALWDWNDLTLGRIRLSVREEDEKTLLIDPASLCPPVIVRTADEGDRICLRDGERKVSELEKDWRIPYSVVLEDRNGIVAVFGRLFGGRDRLSSRFLNLPGRPVTLALAQE